MIRKCVVVHTLLAPSSIDRVFGSGDCVTVWCLTVPP